MSFDVGTDGSLLRVRDWASVQQAIAGIPAAIAATESPAKREPAMQLVRRAIAPYLSMSADRAPDAILKGWPSLFGLGGLELIAGKEYELQGSAPATILPIAVPMTQHLSLTRGSPGTLRLHLDSQPDNEKVGIALSEYMQQLGTGLNVAQKANLAKAAANFRNMKTRDSSDIELNSATGLVERATLERRMSIAEMGEGTDVISVLRVY